MKAVRKNTLAVSGLPDGIEDAPPVSSKGKGPKRGADQDEYVMVPGFPHPVPVLPTGLGNNGKRRHRSVDQCEYVMIPGFAQPVPVLYEDEGKVDVGEAVVHTLTIEILFFGIIFHLKNLPGYTPFQNLDLFYLDAKRKAKISPDIMIVPEERPSYKTLTSYRIGKTGPAPQVALEVLSRWTYEDGDLTKKPISYAAIGVREYILVDVTGKFLPQRLLLKRRQPDDSWVDTQDADGGITSELGFRVVIEPDGQVRVLNAQTGKRYVRPSEAQEATDRCAALEAELARLRESPPQGKAAPKRKKGRRKS
jgi:Uma2 family endonuclease